jgi:hypothetical protein
MGKFDITERFKESLARKECNNDVIIDANKMTDDLFLTADLSSMSRDELERRFIGAYVRCLLHQAGYRSVVRGEGIFASEKTLRAEIVVHFFKNQKLSRDKAEQVLAAIKSHIRNNDTIAGQLEFDFSTGEYRETITTEELLEQLRSQAV